MLEPKPYGQQTIDASFTDFGGTLNAVNGLYNTLSGGDLYRGRNALLYVDYASDDVMATDSKITSAAYNQLDYFKLPADNQQSFDLWDGLYRIVYRANEYLCRLRLRPALPSQPVEQPLREVGTFVLFDAHATPRFK